MSNYCIEFSQHLHGIPILNHFYNGKERYPGEVPSLFPYSSVYCKSPGSALINGNFVTETNRLEGDIPLCDYSVIQGALKEEIASGRLRRVFDMDLGYVLFNEPGASKTEETDHGMTWVFETDGQAYLFIAFCPLIHAAQAWSFLGGIRFSWRKAA